MLVGENSSLQKESYGRTYATCVYRTGLVCIARYNSTLNAVIVCPYRAINLFSALTIHNYPFIIFLEIKR